MAEVDQDEFMIAEKKALVNADGEGFMANHPRQSVLKETLSPPSLETWRKTIAWVQVRDSHNSACVLQLS